MVKGRLIASLLLILTLTLSSFLFANSIQVAFDASMYHTIPSPIFEDPHPFRTHGSVHMTLYPSTFEFSGVSLSPIVHLNYTTSSLPSYFSIIRGHTALGGGLEVGLQFTKKFSTSASCSYVVSFYHHTYEQASFIRYTVTPSYTLNSFIALTFPLRYDQRDDYDAFSGGFGINIRYTERDDE